MQMMKCKGQMMGLECTRANKGWLNKVSTVAGLPKRRHDGLERTVCGKLASTANDNAGMALLCW